LVSRTEKDLATLGERIAGMEALKSKEQVTVCGQQQREKEKKMEFSTLLPF
jgi:hypothetical protein